MPIQWQVRTFLQSERLFVTRFPSMCSALPDNTRSKRRKLWTLSAIEEALEISLAQPRKTQPANGLFRGGVGYLEQAGVCPMPAFLT